MGHLEKDEDREIREVTHDSLLREGSDPLGKRAEKTVFQAENFGLVWDIGEEELRTRKGKNIAKDKRHERGFSPLVIETIRRHYRDGYSMEDIADKIMAMSLATVSKYCRGIGRGWPYRQWRDEFEHGMKHPVVSIAPTATSNRGELAQQQQHQAVRETPSESVRIIQAQSAPISNLSSSDKPPSQVVRTTRLYSGMLPVSWSDSHLIAFTVPSSSTKSALVVTASGPPFYATLFTDSQSSDYSHRGDRIHTWSSHKVTNITEELILPRNGKWILEFSSLAERDAEKISVEISLKTTVSSSTPVEAISCWVGPSFFQDSSLN